MTGIAVSVKDAVQDANGMKTVVLQAANQAYSADMTYDKDTGMIIALSDSKLGVDSNEYTDLKLAQINYSQEPNYLN